MKRLLDIAGAVLAGLGLLWILQGLGVLPGSLMSGHGEWTIYGVCALVIGIAVLVAGRTPRSRRDAGR
jgi:membrane protein implicated in regulation of membrane protease activity